MGGHQALFGKATRVSLLCSVALAAAACGPSEIDAAAGGMKRVFEPNERAFSFLLPPGWQSEGGIFNVNPVQMNGSGNSNVPKTDLSVKKDKAGTVMLRWVPTWNYADLRYSAMGSSFQGRYYQGMPIRPLTNGRDFLIGLLRETRPGISNARIVEEDTLPELVSTYKKLNAKTDEAIRQTGVAPTRFEARAILVEYVENGVPYLEVLQTTIVDMVRSAFLWGNADTVMFRAPKQEFNRWKPVLDQVRGSREWNPKWIESLRQHQGIRAKNAMETQQYLNKRMNEILDNKRQTHSQMAHRNWLMISGREDYADPFSGEKVNREKKGAHRWVSEDGREFYTDNPNYDPNDSPAHYKDGRHKVEWKRSAEGVE
jgi:hypothetical protein